MVTSLQIIGKKKSGKTTTTVDFIKSARESGLTVATFKHTHHTVSMDIEGTDTARFSQAGSQQVGMQNDAGFFWHETRENGAEIALQNEIDDFVRPDTDLILIEGFKREKFPKLLLLREQDSLSDFSAYDQIEFVGTIFPSVLENLTDKAVSQIIDLTTEEKRKEWLKSWLTN